MDALTPRQSVRRKERRRSMLLTEAAKVRGDGERVMLGKRVEVFHESLS